MSSHDEYDTQLDAMPLAEIKRLAKKQLKVLEYDRLRSKVYYNRNLDKKKEYYRVRAQKNKEVASTGGATNLDSIVTMPNGD